MPTVKRVEKFEYRGGLFNTIDAIEELIENKLGAIIDKMDVTLTPKQKLNILNTIIDERDPLVELLSVALEDRESPFHKHSIFTY